MARSADENPLTIEVRLARPDDLAAVVELWDELIDFHYALDSYFETKPNASELAADFLREQIESPKATVLVAQTKGGVVGYLMAERSARPPVFEGGDVMLITDTCVRRGFRRLGVGKALVDELLRITRELGITRVEVGYNARNQVSSAFWQKMGFQPFSAKAYMELKSRPRQHASSPPLHMTTSSEVGTELRNQE